MRIKNLLNIPSCLLLIYLTSCSVLNPSKKTTIIKNETSTQTTPAGTIETAVVSRTETIVEKNPKQLTTSSQNDASQNEPPFPPFTQKDTTITKDNVNIKISSKPTDVKNVATYEVDTLHQDSTIGSTGSDLDCYTTKIKITANSSTFMNADYEAQAQHIYPGAIYYYDDFIAGKYKEINLPRNSIKLSSDNPNILGSTFNTISNPDYSSIRDGIANLYSRFDNRQVGTMNLRYRTYETNTNAEFSLRLSAGGSFAGFSLENEYKNTSKSTSHNLTIDAIKPLYTITTLLPKNYKNYFQSKNGIDSNKNPIIIKSVTYGVRVLANFILNTNTKEELNNFNAHYKGITSSGHVDFNYLENKANTDQTINCFVVGGPGSSTVAFDKKQLEEGLQKLIAEATYATARPISYEIQDLAGNIIETKSTTDEITTIKCVPHVNPPILQSIIFEIQSGGDPGGKDGKDGDTELWIDVFKGVGFTNQIASFHEKDDINFPGGSLVMRNISGNSNNNGITTTLIPNINKIDFSNYNGGSIRIRIQPHGSDTWKIIQFKASLVFQDGTIEPIKFNSPFEVSDESKEYPLFFKGNFESFGN